MHGMGEQGKGSSRSYPGRQQGNRSSARFTPYQKGGGELEGQGQLILSLDLGWISLPAADSAIIRWQQWYGSQLGAQSSNIFPSTGMSLKETAHFPNHPQTLKTAG